MRFWIIVFFIIINILVLGVIVAYIWRYQQMKYYREQYELEDKRVFYMPEVSLKRVSILW